MAKTLAKKVTIDDPFLTFYPPVCEEGPGICSLLLTIGSLLLIIASLPVSLVVVIKVVQVKICLFQLYAIPQEYERAVIFRLGRLLTGGARGPGVFFIIPCVDVFEKIDMRTMTYEIPPQEVGLGCLKQLLNLLSSDPYKGQRNSVCQCHHVLQGQEPNPCCGKCRRLWSFSSTFGGHHS